ncbi:MAG: divergent PAP2 family protein [Candidatus Moranbacteria bacterium]|nr:divergent PAP2 family protein [Candidatus Moranbacteria bacterium]
MDPEPSLTIIHQNLNNALPIVIIPTIMWFVSQFLKFSIYSAKHGLNFKYLFEYGHLPSSHSASMAALIYATYKFEGLSSPVFAIAFTVGLMTIFDAVKLRGYIGKYGETLNKLIKDSGFKKNNQYPRLKERVGHTITEVVTGAILGLIGAYLLVRLLYL